MNQQPSHQHNASGAPAAKAPEAELRLIVRILNKDLKGEEPIFMSLQGIKGVGQRMGQIFARKFQEETGTPFNAPLGTLSEDLDKKLEDIIANPVKHGIPEWTLNRRRVFETGLSTHHTQNELDFDLRNDLERLKRIKAYRGIRHMFGLPARGQRTRSSFRERGKTVGVQKKDQAAGKGGAKPAAAAAPAKGAEKKK